MENEEKYVAHLTTKHKGWFIKNIRILANELEETEGRITGISLKYDEGYNSVHFEITVSNTMI